MSIVLVGSTSGSITLQEPAIAGTTVLSLPATSGTLITTGSSGQSIPKAALPTGSVLQVVEGTTASETFTTSTSYVSTNLSATITPTSASSKILVIVSSTMYAGNTSYNTNATVYRGGSDIASANSAGVLFAGDGWTGWAKLATTILDSPASTSALTYQLYVKVNNASHNGGANRNNTRNSIVLMEIAA